VTVALITGISGQDGAYLAKFLLAKGYTVFGTYRRSSTVNLWRLEELGIRDHPNLKLVVHDLTDPSSCIRVIEMAKPDEVYNLGAQSFVATSFEQPATTTDITGLGALNLLEAIRILDRSIRFYQASSAEMFGLVQQIPQSETTPFYPRSPYAVAKLYAHWMTINYRESYGIFASCGILFNHESPLRGMDFVTRKITHGVARAALGEPGPILLGNLNAERDWGYAPEYVAGMWAMLQAPEPDTFVFATNATNSVRSFVEWAFQAVDVHIEWSGTGAEERGICRETGRVLVEVSPEFYRPAEVESLIGDASKAERVIGWRPSTPVRELCAKMVAADLQRQYQKRGESMPRQAFEEMARNSSIATADLVLINS
jgi:GDPmannose 4,6-dehydratase